MSLVTMRCMSPGTSSNETRTETTLEAYAGRGVTVLLDDHIRSGLAALGGRSSRVELVQEQVAVAGLSWPAVARIPVNFVGLSFQSCFGPRSYTACVCADYQAAQVQNCFITSFYLT